MIAKEKSALTRRELQEIVILTSKLTTQLWIILTRKGDHLFSSFGITKGQQKLKIALFLSAIFLKNTIYHNRLFSANIDCCLH